MKVFVSSRELMFKSIAEQIEEALKKKPSRVIALPTGSTPLGLYKELVERFEHGEIDFSKAIFINLDEYAGLAQGHSQAYARFLRKSFLDKINALEKNIFLFDGKGDLKKQAAQREEFVKKKGIDIALLGIGENSHIAFNEPGSAFNSKTRIVNLAASTRKANARFFKKKENVPKQAVTMGLSTIMRAKKIVLMAIGKKKAIAIKKMLGKPSEQVPASILQKHPNVEIFCNEEAGFLLDNALSIEYNDTAVFSEKNLPKKKRAVFISPHPDDSAIAAGATLSMLAKHNNVFVFVMTSGYRAVKNSQSREQKKGIREKESIAEAKVLKTTPVFLNLEFYDEGEKSFVRDKKKVLDALNKARPDIVFLPQESDTHPTHKFSRRLTLEAMARLKKKPEIWNYETPWGLFTHKGFNAIVEFSNKILETKDSAIKKHLSQTKRTRFDVAAKNIARFRAIVIGEQILSDFGRNSPKTLPFMELFKIEPSSKTNKKD